MVLVALLAGLPSCGLRAVGGPISDEEWDEVFEFDLQPGTMNPAEAERALDDMMQSDELVSGSVTHRGWVAAPGGRIDFYAYRMIDPIIGAQPAFCTATVAETWMSADCGSEPTAGPDEPVQATGETWGGRWRSADLAMQDDVVRAEATAVDGTAYTIVPLNGYGYIEWLDERGSLEIVAYDAEDRELGRTVVGLDQ